MKSRVFCLLLVLATPAFATIALEPELRYEFVDSKMAFHMAPLTSARQTASLWRLTPTAMARRCSRKERL